MFDASIYIQRRKKLMDRLGSGLALFIGNEDSPRNYQANPYHFRQDSTFLYFYGLDYQGLAGIVDADEGRGIVFGDDVTMDDIIWMGSMPLLKDNALKCGITETMPAGKLSEVLKDAIRRGRTVRFLPPYRAETALKISDLLGLQPRLINDYSSSDFIKAVVEQRSVKSEGEIEEIGRALSTTHKMYLAAMGMAKSGKYERELVGRMEEIVFAEGCRMAFPPILSINGQILHNHYHGNKLKKGRLVVCDSGAESAGHYASDITRTFPVDGEFTPRQKDVYQIVLDTQTRAMQEIRPGVTFKEIHMSAARTIASGLKDLGVVKGDTDDAVREGAHALFMPHGLGHQLGLDVHDMENLGEKFVGYDEKVKRSEQFGIAALRYGKEMPQGLVLTVEPGIYFIPALIDKWRAEGKFAGFIDYDRVEEYKDFGGIRIEDDVLVTDNGSRVLGKPIPKTVKQVEEATGKE